MKLAELLEETDDFDDLESAASSIGGEHLDLNDVDQVEKILKKLGDKHHLEVRVGTTKPHRGDERIVWVGLVRNYRTDISIVSDERFAKECREMKRDIAALADSNHFRIEPTGIPSEFYLKQEAA